jgi:single-strand DNA-binding protein
MFETPLTVVGRIVTDLIQKDTAGGRLCSFRVMASERRFNRDTQDWMDGDRLFLTVKCWRKLAENVGASLFRGDNVVVSGRLFINEYQTNDGQQRSDLELDARAVGPNLTMCTAMLERPIRTDIAGDDLVAVGAQAA